MIRPRALLLAAVWAAGPACTAVPESGGPVSGVAVSPVRFDVAVIDLEPGASGRAALEKDLAGALRDAIEALGDLPCRVGDPAGGEAGLRLEVTKIEQGRGDPVLYSYWQLVGPGGRVLDRYAGRFDTGNPPLTGPAVARVTGGEAKAGLTPLQRAFRLYALMVADRVNGALRVSAGAGGAGATRGEP